MTRVVTFVTPRSIQELVTTFEFKPKLEVNNHKRLLFMEIVIKVASLHVVFILRLVKLRLKEPQD